MAGEESASEEAGPAGSVKSSAALMGDLEELRGKIEKYHARQNSEELSTVRAKGEEVVSCYKYVCFRPVRSRFRSHVASRSHPTTTLDCWKAVEEFRASVAQVEQVRNVLFKIQP